MSRVQMIKSITRVIKEFTKKGLDVEKITKGKTIEQLAWNKNTYKEFTKNVKRQRQLPKIIEENKRIDEKIKKEVEERIKKKLESSRKSSKRNYLSKATQDRLKFGKDKLQPTKLNARFKVQTESDAFLNRYFKGIKDHAKTQKRIEKIQKRLGTRLDLLYDLIDEFGKKEYQYKMEKGFMQKEQTDEYEQSLYDRFDDIEDILTEYGL